MKHNKKWQAFLLISLMAIATIGCEQSAIQPENTSSTSAVASSKPTALAQAKADDSIYNTAFENYNNITELGLIVNEPTQEDFSRLTTLESFGKDDKQPMLLIPKYTGCKVTVSLAEFTGERYIAKKTVFTNESTPEGYGLRLNLLRPDGIPQYIVTINYENKTYDYVITSNGKDGNSGVEYLQVAADNGKKQQGDLIRPIQDPTYLKGLNRFSHSEADVDKDGEDESIEVYCDGEINSKGEKLLDDSQTWTLVMRKGKDIYPLFEKDQIQLGKIGYTIYQDYENYEKVHILVSYRASARVYYYDCTYDDTTGNMLRTKILDTKNINLIDSWD